MSSPDQRLRKIERDLAVDFGGGTRVVWARYTRIRHCDPALCGDCCDAHACDDAGCVGGGA